MPRKKKRKTSLSTVVMHRPPARAWAAAGIATALLATTAVLCGAGAHDHLAPKSHLFGNARSSLQRGLLSSNCWVDKRRGQFEERCADAVWKFPAASKAPAGPMSVRILFEKDQRPHDVKVVAWPAVDADQRPVGQGEEIEVRIKKTEWSGGATAYVLKGQVTLVGDLYMWAFARWHDEQGSGLHQDAAWTFHVRSY